MNGRPEHPLKLWRESKGYSVEEVSKLICALGHQAAPEYIKAIEDGYRRGSYALAKVVTKLTSGEIAIDAFMEHPFQSRGKRHRRDAA